MKAKFSNGGIYNNQQICSPVDLHQLQASSSPMQYTQYSSVVLTPTSTTVSSPSPQSTNSFSPIYTEECDYNMIQTNIKQEPISHFSNNLTSNMLLKANLNYQLEQQNQLNQLNQIKPNQSKNNKRSADDNQAANVKRGRSRQPQPNQTNSNKSKSEKINRIQLNEQGQIVKPTRTRRTRAKSPSLVQKLQKTRRLKANDRERTRMHNLNRALERLREILPISSSLSSPTVTETALSRSANEETNDSSLQSCSNKLTKIETLRFANSYIMALKNMLQMDISQLDPSKSPNSCLRDASEMAAANCNLSNSQNNLLLPNNQNRYSDFSSLFQTNSLISSNGIPSTTSSLSNDEDDEDLMMIMNGDGCMSQNEDIFEQQQQSYHLN